MAVAHDADSIANSGAAVVASQTWSHTVTGANTLLVVGLVYTGSSTTMGITYAGASPTGQTSIVDCNNVNTSHTRIWWWVNPTTGANNIVATPSVSAGIFGGGTSFTGVDQTNPVFSFDRTNSFGSSFGTISRNMSTSTVNEMLFELIGMANATSTLAAGAPATEAFNQGDATVNNRAEGQWLLATSKAKYTVSQTISGSTARAWAQQLIGINPVDAVDRTSTAINNYQFVQAPDGISVSEKIR